MAFNWGLLLLLLLLLGIYIYIYICCDIDIAYAVVVSDGQLPLFSIAEGVERKSKVAEDFRGLISTASPMGSAWQFWDPCVLSSAGQCRAVQWKLMVSLNLSMSA